MRMINKENVAKNE